jgi:hypothetical protein
MPVAWLEECPFPRSSWQFAHSRQAQNDPPNYPPRSVLLVLRFRKLPDQAVNDLLGLQGWCRPSLLSFFQV